jgi:hypothetical protein
MATTISNRAAMDQRDYAGGWGSAEALGATAGVLDMMRLDQGWKGVPAQEGSAIGLKPQQRLLVSRSPGVLSLLSNELGVSIATAPTPGWRA